MEKTIKDLTSKSNTLVAILSDLPKEDELYDQLTEEDDKIQVTLDELGECKSQAQFLKWSSEKLLDLFGTCLWCVGTYC